MQEDNNNNATLCSLAFETMNTSDPLLKVEKTRKLAQLWQSNQLEVGSSEPCEHPPRPSSFTIVDQFKAPRVGNAGSLQSRINILHCLANVEQWAIDVALDNIVRFSMHESQLPKQYYDDFVRMALDESNHFTWLNNRLMALGSEFGKLAIHEGIWDSAHTTKTNLMGRMAIVHMVHEARGLDVNPNTIKKFQNNKDYESSDMLQTIYKEEIEHVKIGQRWFSYLCDYYNLDKGEAFKSMVKQFYGAKLKPPFNKEARTLAGMEAEWYENSIE